MIRSIAVDWSGARHRPEQKIWLCEVVRGQVRRLEPGRNREQVVDHLIERAGEPDTELRVGLDFAFSFPAGFLTKRAHHEVASVWREAEALGERWLAHCPFPFWGKPGSTKPPLGHQLHRQTEIDIARETGLRPFSVFQIGGAGAVGVGSIRGMPLLTRLRSAGFSVWPFDAADPPMVLEIWPRLFLGGLRKADPGERQRFLDRRLPQVTGPARQAARDSDDALDALVTALAMDRHGGQLAGLAAARDPIRRLEGEIWRPLPEPGSPDFADR